MILGVPHKHIFNACGHQEHQVMTWVLYESQVSQLRLEGISEVKGIEGNFGLLLAIPPECLIYFFGSNSFISPLVASDIYY